MRKRWIQDPETLELVPAEEYVPRGDELTPHFRVVGDLHYDGLRATDGADISTRAKHRAYMREKGLTTMDDFTNQFAKAAQDREAYRERGVGGAVTRQDIGRAIHELETGRKAER